MNIDVLSRGEAERASCEVCEPTYIISISDPDADYPDICTSNENVCDVLYLKFRDLLAGDIGAMTNRDALKIAEFLGNVPDTETTHIIVHCNKGESRSAGIAQALLEFYDGDASVITEDRFKFPNPTCYEKVLAALMENYLH